ncbi:MAG: FHA domain-containing protein [Desulfosarcinaceae bacterium]|jgi:hypothetical protein
MVAQSTRYKLQIVAGLHEGAELCLQEGECYTVGSGERCDIVLLDNGIAAEHLRLSVSKGKAYLLETQAATFIDGQKLSGCPQGISAFQVVSCGKAHFAIGPADAAWPDIDTPACLDDTCFVATRDLVPVFADDRLPKKSGPEDRLKRVLHSMLKRISQTNRKLLVAVSVFMMALFIFISDTWFSYAVLDTVEENHPTSVGKADQRPMESPLLALVDGIKSVHQDTLINTGLAEPSVPTESLGETLGLDPVDHIRQALKNTWGDQLTETAVTANGLQFTGFDDNRRQDLRMELEQNSQGDIQAKAVTLTPKKKKEILSQIGDLIHVKVDLSEDMENVCQRVLIKKGIRNARARYNIQENAFTLEGQSKDTAAIDTISEVIAKAFPDILVKNDIHKQIHKPARARIKAVSTSGLPYVILNDGSKVFTGGELNNGCTIAAITGEYILMECNGLKRRQKL